MRNTLRKLVAAVVAAGLIFAATATAEEPPSQASASKEASHANDWKFSWELYGFLASIKGETVSGGDIDISLDDILGNLNLIFFSGFGATKGKWGAFLDVIYLDMYADEGGTRKIPIAGNIGLSETVKVDVGMSAWVLTPTVQYNLLDNDKINLSVLGGARYLWIQSKQTIADDNRFKYRQYKFKESGDVWDAIVGVRGRVPLGDKWYLPYYFDIGTGDTQLTWQVFGGVGYRFKHFDLVAGYRYMDWNFDDDHDVFGDLNLSGPMIGAKFTF